MIRYLAANKIDKDKWDECINGSINGMVYAQSWYLDMVAPGWEALVEGDYESVFPLVTRRKWGINYLFQPVFTQQLGIFSGKVLSEELVQRFIQSIPNKFRFAEINLNTFNKAGSGKYKVYNWKNHELDLINTYERISRNYSTNLKRNLKKAAGNKPEVLKNVKPDNIIRLFRENKGKHISRLGEEDYTLLTRLVYAAIYKGMAFTWGVFSDRNELCAGIIFLRSKNKVIFYFSGLSDEGRDNLAMPYLIDHFIRENAQKHLTLDFEGSNDPNLARFYKSFGAREIHYPHITFNRLNPLIRIPASIIKGLK
ncbi:MAG: hypothetical protein KDC05_02795 [Bacteroidales bacterium]|nr:hypothetical protein [Bacteroidales bacterium]